MEKLWENSCFSGWLQLALGNTARVAMARLGSLGLMLWAMLLVSKLKDEIFLYSY